MDMYQCVTKTSSEEVCLLAPCTSDRLGTPRRESSAGIYRVCDTIKEVKGFISRFRDEFGLFSFMGLSFNGETSESESNRQNKSTFGAFSMSYSKSSLMKKSDLHSDISSTKASSRLPRRCQTESSTLGADLLSSIVVSRHLVFLLMILFRTILVEGVPVHKTRHHHFKPDDLPLCSQRFRRDIQSMSVKESQTAGLCPSRACLDVDERRRPIHITRVFCLPSENSSCSTLGGDFQCTQVHVHMEIWKEDNKPSGAVGLTELWTTDNKTRAMVPTKIRVEHGCLCASESARPAVNPIHMVY